MHVTGFSPQHEKGCERCSFRWLLSLFQVLIQKETKLICCALNLMRKQNGNSNCKVFLTQKNYGICDTMGMNYY